MKKFPFVMFAVIGILNGLLFVSVLLLLQAIIQAFAPTFMLPFSHWWGMAMAIPSLAGVVWFHLVFR